MQETRLSQAMAELGSAQAQLDEKQAELDRVQAEYDKAMAEKQRLAGDADACRRKMSNATALIEGLSGELHLPSALGLQGMLASLTSFVSFS